MAPRGRTRRPRLSRMDAAIDAMSPFGFSEGLVQKTVKNLLWEYGGDESWVFIEADAYNVLIEAILNEQEKSLQEENNEETCAGEERLLKDNTSQDERGGDHAVLATAGPSGGFVGQTSSEATNTSSHTDTAEVKDRLPLSEGAGKGWKDIVLDQNCRAKEIVNTINSTDGNVRGEMDLDKTPFHSPSPVISSPSPVIPSPPPVNHSRPTQRRKPCYGWISSDDEDDDFIMLTPARQLTPCRASRQLDNMIDVTEKRVKRKSRWDVRPEDM